MTSIRVKCVGCNKEFWVKFKKDEPQGDVLHCKECRNRMARTKEREARLGKRVKIVAEKPDYRQQIETLRQIERYNPRALDKLREPRGK